MIPCGIMAETLTVVTFIHLKYPVSIYGKNEQPVVIYATLSYLIWGFTPVYWKLFAGISSVEILAHRMFWAFFVSIAMLAFSGGLNRLKRPFSDPETSRMDNSSNPAAECKLVYLCLGRRKRQGAGGQSRVLPESDGQYLPRADFPERETESSSVGGRGTGCRGCGS